ncbi:MAG TPA: (2Fe-2S)-binding protein [Terriglobales bacterium]|nr:(2Fe-2S)-binding protein [Terriglobales bacterium]
MPERVTISVDGQSVTVPSGTVVAAALEQIGKRAVRQSVSGEPRGPLCGMGICFECCVTINGRPFVRGCMTVCESDMEVRTHG